MIAHFLYRCGAVLLLVVAGAIPLTRSRITSAASSSLPAFGQPIISGVQGNGFEQDLRLDTAGRIYTSAPDSLSSTISFIWRSLDGGQTFKWVPAASQPDGKVVPACVGGGDSELATDSANNLYFNDLTLANFSTARSSDQGRTFAPFACAATSDVVVDRQWYAVDGDPTTTGNIFLAYDRVAQAAVVNCPDGTISTAGNNLLVLARSPLPGGQAAAGVEFAPSQPISCDEGIMGNDEFYTYPDTGKRVFVIHDNAALNSISVGRCDVVPFVLSATGLGNCVNVQVSSFPTARTGGNFPTMAIDSQGHLYAVWEQAPVDSTGKIVGNTVLMYATSTDEGATWSTTQQIPTPGLNNNVFAWIAAGDSGRVDVAWYGTPASCSGCGGPDFVNGDWSLWMAQTLNGGTSWTAPILASQHFIHRGNIQTVMGGQAGDRTLGDFLQLRIGSQGEANISYADSNNIDEATLPHAMFVRQSGGTSVSATNPTVKRVSSPGNAVTDPAGDATFDNAGTSTANQPNLDILASSVSMPDTTHYQIKMKVADLTSLKPAAPTEGTDLVWLTQWLVPSQSDPKGGKNFFVYMESTNGAPPTCWSGENAETADGGGVIFTYPGNTQLTGSACTYTTKAPGTITITVPTANVSEAAPLNAILYSVTASTMALPSPANTIPSTGGLGGTPPNLIDVAPGYDFSSTR
ncbi:MAG TPA: sialidase family protein [Chloroflexota bacterium]